MTTIPTLSVRSLSVNFGSNQVVKNLSLDVYPGKTTAIVGESGSGKSVTSLAIMRLVEYMNAEITSGAIRLHRDVSGSQPQDLTQLSDKAMRKIRGKEIAMIFQEPMTSLNPVYTIGDQITEVLVLHEKHTQASARAEAVKLLELVRLADAEALLKRYPHQLSGGMRQRVMIAMATGLPSKGSVNELTTALDVTISVDSNHHARPAAGIGNGGHFHYPQSWVVAEMATKWWLCAMAKVLGGLSGGSCRPPPTPLYPSIAGGSTGYKERMQGEDLPRYGSPG